MSGLVHSGCCWCWAEVLLALDVLPFMTRQGGGTPCHASMRLTRFFLIHARLLLVQGGTALAWIGAQHSAYCCRCWTACLPDQSSRQHSTCTARAPQSALRFSAVSILTLVCATVAWLDAGQSAGVDRVSEHSKAAGDWQ